MILLKTLRTCTLLAVLCLTLPLLALAGDPGSSSPVANTGSTFSAWVATEAPSYVPGTQVSIDGGNFGPSETVTVQILHPDGTPNITYGPYLVTTDANGGFATKWDLPLTEPLGETLMVSAEGQVTGLTAENTFLASPGVNLDQLQNGTMATSPQWANGNINTNNSCYSEGNSVPYRYVLANMTASSHHYFTIQMEWTKGGVHALDYLVSYDLTEAAAIATAGGACGAPSPAPDCATPTGFYPWPNYLLTSNYTGTIPSDFFTTVNPSFTLDGPGNLYYYNATVDSIGKMYFSGSASDRKLNIPVYFRVTANGSVGMFWGGHLATGQPYSWGIGNGSASVSGAPYHMSAVSLDGAGGNNQDRSIQNGSICLAPDPAISCTPSTTVCKDSVYTCSAASGAASYAWTVTGATIVSGQGTNSLTYHVTAAAGGTVTVMLTACNAASGCPGDYCCATDTVSMSVVTCNFCPVATCHGDTSVYLCAPGQVCIPGFSCTDANGNLVSCTAVGGTLSGGSICFNAPASGVYTLKLIALDGDGCADTCETHVTVTVNRSPVVACHGDTTMFVCNLNQICLPGFSVSDPDGNLKTRTVSGGTLSGGSVCFTPVVGVNTIVLTATDSCNVTVSCTTHVTIGLNRAPDAACPGNMNLFMCSLGPVCLHGFSSTDPDGNLTSTTVNVGSFAGDSVCFTPVAGANTIRLISTDACGKADTCTTLVTVTLNASPDIALGADVDTFLCTAQQFCVNYTVTDPNGMGKLTETLVSGPAGATIDTAANKVCFSGAAAGDYTVTVKVTDSCGASDQDTQVIHIRLNRPPVATCHGDTSIFVCSLGQICLGGFSSSDPDGNLKTTVVTGGTLTGGTVCFTAVAGVNTITLTATDSCGVATSCVTNVTVTLNRPPVVACHNDTTLFVCSLNQVCLPGFGASDPDGNLKTTTVAGGTLAAGSVCFTPVVGANTITLTATDSCGVTAQCVTHVTVALNNPPVATCPGTQSLLVCNLAPICIDGFTCSDPDGNGTGSSVSLGTLNGTQVCFTPVVGPNVIRLICTDACGKADTCTTTINVQLNAPPDVALGIDKQMSLCAPAPICVPYTVSDPDGNVTAEVVLSPAGAVIDTVANTVCFTPAAAGNYTVIVKVTDACGASDQDDQAFAISMDQPPTISMGNDTAIFLCQSQQLCFPYTVADPDGLTGLVEELVSGPGGATIDTAANKVCFSPAASGSFTCVVKVMDPCGATSQADIVVTVTLNSPPVTTFGPDRAVKLCSSQQVCEPYTVADPDGLAGMVETLVSGPAGASIDTAGNKVCYSPTISGVYTFIVKATDKCGASDQDTIALSITVNVGPQVNLTPDSSYFEICLDVDTVICLNYTIWDPDGVKLVESLVSTAGSIDTAANKICLPANASGKYLVVVKATDSCGAFDLDTAIVVVKRVLCCPTVAIEKVHNALQGQYACVDITMQGNKFVMGGYNMLIAYDASSLTPSTIKPGKLLTDCKWEYFTYRCSAEGNCGTGCPSGLIRMVAIAETNNGAYHPTCFGPATADTVKLAEICFLVSNDRTLECQFAPIRFFWIDCGDNAFTTKGGDTTIVSNLIYDYNNPIPINNGAGPLPGYTGAMDYCVVPYQPTKPAALRCIDFYNGGIDIVCADSIDARGDLNLNGMGYEIADAVLFSRYFIQGLGVFTINQAGQVAASDVNADGLTLTVADLVYLIKVVVGDAQPYAKVNPVVTSFTQSGGVLSVADPMGGAFVTVSGNVQPHLLADNMQMMYAFDGTATRILVYPSPSADHLETFSGAFLAVDGEVMSIEFGSAAGSTVEAKLTPNTYSLTQNFPNPFNPSTTIQYNLPTQSRVELAIYDLLGREIRGLVNGEQAAGWQKVEWDGRDSQGNLVSSGIYFYRLTANGYSATRKMVLLK